MNIRQLNLSLVISLFVFSGFAQAINAEEQDKERNPKLFQSKDVFDFEIANDQRISPDSHSVVYVRDSMDIMTDNVRSNLWIVNFDGSEH